MTGKVGPDIVNPEPASDAPLIVKGAVPPEVSITDRGVVAEFTSAFPNARFVALTFSAGTDAFNCKANVWTALPVLAVRVATCCAPTDETLTVKAALVRPAGTVTEVGTATAALLLARLTTKPPLAAAEFKVAVQASVPAPIIVAFAHERALNIAGSRVPVPLRPTTVTPVEESLLSVS